MKRSARILTALPLVVAALVVLVVAPRHSAIQAAEVTDTPSTMTGAPPQAASRECESFSTIGSTPTVTNTPTPTSTPSTPTLEDNFDDGVIDDSLWSVEVARPGYGIWKLPELPPPFIEATEESGELRFAGNGHDYYDYGRVLVTKEAFSGSFTLEVDLTSLSGSGTQWGACAAVIKDDFAAIQLLACPHYWFGWPAGYYDFDWQARESCIDGTPGCPTSPGGAGTPIIGEGDAKPPGPITFPIKLKVVYDGGTEFELYWDMSGDVYEYTHNAPEVYDTYRIAILTGARLGGDSIDARFDNFSLRAEPAPGGGIAEPIVLGSDSAAETPAPSSSRDYTTPIAAVTAGAVIALAAGAWYARRRFRQRRI